MRWRPPPYGLAATPSPRRARRLRTRPKSVGPCRGGSPRGQYAAVVASGACDPTRPERPSLRAGPFPSSHRGPRRHDWSPAHARARLLSSSVGAWQTWSMKRDTPSYHGYRFPPEIISHAVWLYHRFGVSFRDVEDLLAQRGITVSYEAIRLWCLTFGSAYARRLTRRQGRLGDIWHLDEVFVTIQGQRRYLWRAVDQDGDVLDILVQSRRDCRAATRFFRKLLKGQERTPGRLVTDKLSSYRAAHRAVMPSVAHRTDRYANNRAEVSHQPTRQHERHMRRFKSPGQAQRFLVRAWTRPQPLPRWPSPGASGASSGATRTLFSHLGCSHDRRLTRTEITIPSTGSLDER